jgi:hypothetical protein
MTPYKILIHPVALQKAEAYRQTLQAQATSAGAYLDAVLSGKDLSQVGTSEWIEDLLKTKRPQIFAESAVVGDGSDWSPIELSILGDISIAVPVTVYDDGQHAAPQIPPIPFNATLLYVPGALLRNGQGQTPADWHAVIRGGKIDADAYYALYERRLLPGFLYANQVAKALGQPAFITLPGLGCGQFAGKFHGQLGVMLRVTLVRLLENHAAHFSHIRAVYYDPYRECQNERLEMGQISFFVRPLTQGNASKSQLCPPPTYQEGGDDFSRCQLFSFVAWDHVSWPGNDFYLGSRATDDGVKAAATSSMATMTGVAGTYNPHTHTYDPPSGYRNWNAVVQRAGLQIQVRDNLLVLPEKSS